MNYNMSLDQILSKLPTDEVRTAICELQNQGWEFQGEHWEDHHRDDNYDLYFKSPRMEKISRVSLMERLTVKHLMETEEEIFSQQLLKGVRGHLEDQLLDFIRAQVKRQALPEEKMNLYNSIQIHTDADTHTFHFKATVH
jgi:hypothetical protein